MIILDANVLLDLYRYPKDASMDLLDTIEKIKERLWLPHQAVLEYQQNRLNEILKQKNRFYDVKNCLIDNLDKLKIKLGEMQLKKRHPTIDPDQLIENIQKSYDNYINELDELEKKQPNVYDEDEIRKKLDIILKNRIGKPPDSQNDLDEIYKEADGRFENNIPPGYVDFKEKKGEDPYYNNGLIFKREYGDYILWKEILIEFQKRKDVKSAIFITNDKKVDWWLKIGSQKRMTISPRPELVEEIITKTNLKMFYMYNPLRFLEFSKKYLRMKIKQESINQIKDYENMIFQTHSRENDFSFTFNIETFIQFQDKMKNEFNRVFSHLGNIDGITIEPIRWFSTKKISTGNMHIVTFNFITRNDNEGQGQVLLRRWNKPPTFVLYSDKEPMPLCEVIFDKDVILAGYIIKAIKDHCERLDSHINLM